jgi:phenylacetate-coenzyme A ligase PaaK-like adenylate-forming protein
MPLIRYALNDYTGYVDYDMNADSLCARTLPRIYPIETKLEDFIVTQA